MDKRWKAGARCTPYEALKRLGDRELRRLIQDLRRSLNAYTWWSSLVRAAPLDPLQLAEDGHSEALACLLASDEEREWTREDLFNLGRRLGRLYVKAQALHSLRRVRRKPDPDDEFVYEPSPDDESRGQRSGTSIQSHEVDRIGRPFAEPAEPLPPELLKAMTGFFDECTRIRSRNVHAILEFLGHCWGALNAIEISHQSGNARFQEGAIAADLGWPRARVRKIRELVLRYEGPLYIWLEKQGYGELLRDILGPR